MKAGKASSNISSEKIGNPGSVFKFIEARCKTRRVHTALLKGIQQAKKAPTIKQIHRCCCTFSGTKVKSFKDSRVCKYSWQQNTCNSLHVVLTSWETFKKKSLARKLGNYREILQCRPVSSTEPCSRYTQTCQIRTARCLLRRIFFLATSHKYMYLLSSVLPLGGFKNP